QRRDLHVVPVLRGARPNPDGAEFDLAAARDRTAGRGRGRRPRWVTPRRAEVVHELRRRRLLPAIYFIFSRAGCDDAARALASTGLELTTPHEQRRIAEIVADHLSGLGRPELEALGAREWQAMLATGVAAHHAGMVPPFKEA